MLAQGEFSANHKAQHTAPTWSCFQCLSWMPNTTATSNTLLLKFYSHRSRQEGLIQHHEDYSMLYPEEDEQSCSSAERKPAETRSAESETQSDLVEMPSGSCWSRRSHIAKTSESWTTWEVPAASNIRLWLTPSKGSITSSTIMWHDVFTQNPTLLVGGTLIASNTTKVPQTPCVNTSTSACGYTTSAFSNHGATGTTGLSTNRTHLNYQLTAEAEASG